MAANAPTRVRSPSNPDANGLDVNAGQISMMNPAHVGRKINMLIRNEDQRGMPGR